MDIGVYAVNYFDKVLMGMTKYEFSQRRKIYRFLLKPYIKLIQSQTIN